MQIKRIYPLGENLRINPFFILVLISKNVIVEINKIQNSALESCKRRSTCNIEAPKVARRSSRATYCPWMLQENVDVQYSTSESCKRRSTCNILPPKVARESPRAT